MELTSYHLDDFSQTDIEDILFNLGGVLNHIIYFHSMSNQKVMPTGDLESKMLNTFKSLDNFKKLFKESALKVKGSGYTYLVLDKNNNLVIKNTLNQDCPYFHKLIPLLCIEKYRTRIERYETWRGSSPCQRRNSGENSVAYTVNQRTKPHCFFA